ncbi:hypothetical protein THRCLA_07107 [Thraustotheca clavata]|uniref:Secreted protein n=1 Tax=Thraustotheca clavata TaxID=74557 RepID=A0A0A7CM93_9STRA|nr:secreted protein [Thraustotheca clavata]OQR97033.1 hypothetical protein THRCLA_07107 [Thraustotheca clavata]
MQFILWCLILFVNYVYPQINTITFPPSPTPPRTLTPCPFPSVRRPWLSLSSDEKQTYLDAVALGMDKGYHFYFMQILSDPTTNFEFYQTCGWAYSSRRLLLAYQTMLQSLGPQYACLTIPYWDYFADFAQIQTGSCNGNLSNCSSILTEMGGNSGAQTTLIMDQVPVTGASTGTYPLNHFCELYNISCSGFVPRGNWNVSFPTGFGYGTMVNLLNTSPNFYSYTFGLKNTIHNYMHLALGGAMANGNRTMADMLFFSQHAALDMMVQIYIECYLGTDIPTTIKKSSSIAFSICGPTIATLSLWPRQTSNITHRLPLSYANQSTIVDAANHPIIGQFFSPLPTAYFQYVDTNDLGAYSYNYDRNLMVSSLLTNGFICPISLHRRRLRAEAKESAKSKRNEAVKKVNEVKNQVIDMAKELCQDNKKCALALYATVECILFPPKNQACDGDKLYCATEMYVVTDGVARFAKLQEICPFLNSSEAMNNKTLTLVNFMTDLLPGSKGTTETIILTNNP